MLTTFYNVTCKDDFGPNKTKLVLIILTSSLLCSIKSESISDLTFDGLPSSADAPAGAGLAGLPAAAGRGGEGDHVG